MTGRRYERPRRRLLLGEEEVNGRREGLVGLPNPRNGVDGRGRAGFGSLAESVSFTLRASIRSQSPSPDLTLTVEEITSFSVLFLQTFSF